MTTSTTQADIPSAELAALTVRAASIGVSLPYYLGVLVLQSACGITHPTVVEFRNRLIEGGFRAENGGIKP